MLDCLYLLSFLERRWWEKASLILTKKQRLRFFYGGVLISFKIPLLFISEILSFSFKLLGSQATWFYFSPLLSCFAFLAHLCILFLILIINFLIFLFLVFLETMLMSIRFDRKSIKKYKMGTNKSKTYFFEFDFFKEHQQDENNLK